MPVGRTPTAAELDEIHRARLYAGKLADALTPGAAIHVRGASLRAMYDWPRDAELVGFRRDASGAWAFAGHPVREVP